MSLVRLQLEGFTEHEVRRHSAEWMEQAAQEAQRRYRLHLADTLEAIAAGVSVANSDDGQQAELALKEMTGQLRGPDDEDVNYFLDPNAAPDMEALRSSGFLQYEPVPQEPNGG